MRSPRLVAAVVPLLAVLAAAVLPALPSSQAVVTPTQVAALPGAAGPGFKPLPGFSPRGDKVRVRPTSYRAVGVDLKAVRGQLAGGRISVPTPSGGLERFAVEPSEVLAPGLAAAHPEIATYTGRSLSNPLTTIAVDVTPMGFHAAVRGANGQGAWYVDPAYNLRGTTQHLSYRGGATTQPAEEFVEREAPSVRRAVALKQTPGGPVAERRYRLALSSDPSYATYFGTENVLAEKATLIARVNQIYEQDLAISLQLINQTDQLNFDTLDRATGAYGPCGAEPCYRTSIYPGDPDDYGDLDFCSGETLARNRLVLGQVIGADRYDVGHIALGNNGGGVAYLGVVGADYKGGGCTGLPIPKGDFFAIDYVAHELGHQFAGNHTFNGVQYACSGGNRNGSTSVEPGSGSSVMAYAGICLQDDLQAHTDPYFSYRTLDEVNAYTRAELPDTVEVQTVSLAHFGGPATSFDLGFGVSTPVTITAATYSRATLESAVESLTGRDVTIAEWGYDPYGSYTEYPAPIGTLTTTGFQVIFDPSPAPDAPGAHPNIPTLRVENGSPGSPGVSGFVGETARGGANDNGGQFTVPTADTSPVITRITYNGRIPTRTPFVLSGHARDADGDPLTYLWEQTDTGLSAEGTSLVSNRKVYGPLFRVFGTAATVSADGTFESPSPGLNLADGNGTRYFPDLAQVLAGNTNAVTGRCPDVAPLPADLDDYEPVAPKVVECYSEFLPTKAYLGTQRGGKHVLHFRLTVRDARGGVSHRAVRLKVVPKTGPFLVTSQRQGARATAGRTMNVAWAVNGTYGLTKRVNIRLSTNGGRTWRYALATGTPNDGAQQVRLPKGASAKNARVMVEAGSGYFYAVNESGFRIR